MQHLSLVTNKLDRIYEISADKHLDPKFSHSCELEYIHNQSVRKLATVSIILLLQVSAMYLVLYIIGAASANVQTRTRSTSHATVCQVVCCTLCQFKAVTYSYMICTCSYSINMFITHILWYTMCVLMETIKQFCKVSINVIMNAKNIIRHFQQ